MTQMNQQSFDSDLSSPEMDLEPEPHPALSNLDVMEQVFAFLPADDLKSCRLVSKIWEEGATHLLGRETIFPILKLQYGIPVHPGVLQNIKIFLPDEPASIFSNISDHLRNYLPFFTSHRKQIQRLLFKGGHLTKLFWPGVTTLLAHVRLPNLKQISLIEHPDLELASRDPPVPMTSDEETELMNYSGPNLTLLSNLDTVTRLEVRVGLHGMGYLNQMNLPAFQFLILKCINVEELKIAGSFTPDLSNMTRLKSLVWEGPRVKRDRGQNVREDAEITYETTDFSLVNLLKMVEQVAGTLESLVLGSQEEREAEERYVRGIVDGEVEKEIVKDVGYELYSRMPKLVNLFVSDVNIFAISPESLTQDRLPALKSLAVQSTQKYEFPIIRTFLPKWTSQNLIVNSESLSTNQCQAGTSDIWRDIAITFPNLKRLQFVVTARDTAQLKNDHIAPALKNTLNLISHLLPNLEKLTIVLKFPFTLKELMDSIYAEGYRRKGLKQLKLVCAWTDTSTSGCTGHCDNFRKPFMLFKNLVLEDFAIGDDTRRKMMDFIKEKKLFL